MSGEITPILELALARHAADGTLQGLTTGLSDNLLHKFSGLVDGDIQRACQCGKSYAEHFEWL